MALRMALTRVARDDDMRLALTLLAQAILRLEAPPTLFRLCGSNSKDKGRYCGPPPSPPLSLVDGLAGVEETLLGMLISFTGRRSFSSSPPSSGGHCAPPVVPVWRLLLLLSCCCVVCERRRGFDGGDEALPPPPPQRIGVRILVSVVGLFWSGGEDTESSNDDMVDLDRGEISLTAGLSFGIVGETFACSGSVAGCGDVRSKKGAAAGLALRVCIFFCWC